MPKIQKQRSGGYTVIGNHALRNKELSLKAVGLLVKMWSLPDGWNFSVKGMASICKDGELSVRNAIHELEEQGYLCRGRERKDNGLLGDSVWDLFDEPKVNEPMRENHAHDTDAQLITKELSKEMKEDKDIKDSACENFTSCVEEIVGCLNELAMTSYRPTTPKTKSLIRARMNEGFTVEDFKKVIAFKVMKWTNTDFAPYLRPDTLFSTKFESYLNEAERCLAEKRGEVNVRGLFKQFCDSYRFSGMAYRLNDDNSVTNLTMNRTMPFKEWVNAI